MPQSDAAEQLLTFSMLGAALNEYLRDQQLERADEIHAIRSALEELKGRELVLEFTMREGIGGIMGFFPFFRLAREGVAEIDPEVRARAVAVLQRKGWGGDSRVFRMTPIFPGFLEHPQLDDLLVACSEIEILRVQPTDLGGTS